MLFFLFFDVFLVVVCLDCLHNIDFLLDLFWKLFDDLLSSEKVCDLFYLFYFGYFSFLFSLEFAEKVPVFCF